jgi:hypothetical protein
VFRLPYSPVDRQSRQQAIDLLQAFKAEDWVGSELELLEDEQFILCA